MEQQAPIEESGQYFIHQMIELYSKPLTQFAFTYVKDWDTALDIVQDVFLKVYKNKSNLSTIKKPKAWLYQVTANLSKDYLRKQKRKQVIYQVLRLGVKQQEAEPSTEHTFMKQWTNQELGNAILQLKLEEREVIILYYYEGFTLSEIHNLLQVPLPTLKSRLQRGRNRLKNLIERNFEYGSNQTTRL